MPAPVVRGQQPAFQRRFTFIRRFNQSLIFRVPLFWKIEPALLNPAIKVSSNNSVGKIQQPMFGLEEFDRRCFFSDAFVS